MTRQELKAAVEAAKAETKTALETMYAALNQGQKKKIVKEEKVKDLFSRYDMEFEG